MTLKEYNERLGNAADDVESSLSDTMVTLGTEALAIIKQRVQQEGIDAQGKKFDKYSDDPTLTNCSAMTTSACSRIAGSKQKRKDLKWVTLKRGGKNVKLFQLPKGYKQFRELHGRQTGFVDFTFFGRLWSSMKIISNKTQHDSGFVEVGPSTSDQLKILEGNVARKGQILDLSDAEVQEIADRFEIETLNIMRNNGL